MKQCIAYPGCTLFNWIFGWLDVTAAEGEILVVSTTTSKVLCARAKDTTSEHIQLELHCLHCLWCLVYPWLFDDCKQGTPFWAVPRHPWVWFQLLLKDCCCQETTKHCFVSGCCFVFGCREHCLDTLQKCAQCLCSLYRWLQCLKQADTEQVCSCVWVTVGNINHSGKAEQSVMETVGIVVETRKAHCILILWLACSRNSRTSHMQLVE